MTSVMSNAPKINEEKTKLYTTAVTILVLIAIVPLISPVVEVFITSFSKTEGLADNIYYVLRGIFGVSLVVATVIYVVNKNISAAAIPASIGFIMVLFPLIENTAALINTIKLSSQLSINVDYTLNLVNIAEYLLFVLLCLFTALFSIGLFKNVLTILLLSVLSSLAAVFIAMDRHITLLVPIYEILTFAYSIPVALIPTFLTLSADPESLKQNKYEARRMK